MLPNGQNQNPDIASDGYIDLEGVENTRRLAAHQAYLIALGIPEDATRNVDHIGINAQNTEAFEHLIERYRVAGEKVGIYDRGDRHVAVVWRGAGQCRVELFEPRAGQPAAVGFIHYAFIWPDWKAREAELHDKATVTRIAELNGNPLAFLATPDGYEAEIVSRPISFEA